MPFELGRFHRRRRNARDFNPEHTTLARSLFWQLASILVISDELVAPNDLGDFIDLLRDHSRVGSPDRDQGPQHSRRLI